MFFLYLILIIFAIGFIAVLAAAYKLYKAYHRAKDALFGKQGNRKRHKSDFGTGQSYRSRTSYEEETITDLRSGERQSRKIFAKDEGEYVDFEEEK